MKQDCALSMCDRVWICIIFNKILRLRRCPQYTLNKVLLNFIEHMKKMGGGQLDIRPPNPKIGGDVSPHPPPQDWRPCYLEIILQELIWRTYFLQEVLKTEILVSLLFSLMAVYSYCWHQESHDIAQNNVIHSGLYSIY